jgi:hypothetical protein
MIRILFALAAVFFAFPASAQSLPFEGRWAIDAAWCKRGTLPKDAVPPVVLTKQKLTSPVLTCNFGPARPDGALYRVEADCVDPKTKEKGRELFGFARKEDTLLWLWGNKTITLSRCPS